MSPTRLRLVQPPPTQPAAGPFTLADVAGAAAFKDGYPFRVSAEDTHKIVSLALVQVIGLNCLGRGRAVAIDLGNGHVLNCTLAESQERAA